jgi:very-short-patch-repair endonuclease
MLDQAKTLRKNMTEQEKKLWYQYLRHYPVRFYKQRILLSFIVDFYCSEAKLVIEVDGAQHYTDQGKAYDEERTFMLEQFGLKIIRFSNYEVDHSFEAVCRTIDYEIKCRTGIEELIQ